MVSLLTCLNALLVDSWTIPSILNLQSRRFPEKIIYFCLPFTRIHSLQIRAQIDRLCNGVFPHLDTGFVFRSSRRIASFCPFKNKVHKYLSSSVVYLFKCRCCSASYVSQTTRHLRLFSSYAFLTRTYTCVKL